LRTNRWCVCSTPTFDEAGFRVIDAVNADEAVALIEARPDIRAVVTDVEMTGSMNGFDLGQHVAEKRPFVGLLIVSGRKRPSPNELPDDGRFLAKPYTATDLLRELHEALQIHELKRRS
jgi:two-component system, response regulator PdtaR